MVSLPGLPLDERLQLRLEHRIGNDQVCDGIGDNRITAGRWLAVQQCFPDVPEIEVFILFFQCQGSRNVGLLKVNTGFDQVIYPEGMGYGVIMNRVYIQPPDPVTAHGAKDLKCYQISRGEGIHLVCLCIKVKVVPFFAFYGWGLGRHDWKRISQFRQVKVCISCLSDLQSYNGILRHLKQLPPDG